ncbi:hydrogenase small subunit [Bacillus sp. BRMEA1]|uniref:hydrogenase small subunit n=1 Tax=Neobacillus endophyticus TaxID=2738405 RepID=UPI001565EF28|nr:hydrogenase small subunit [Neobacillus endophyticus]NRD80478.1 hydrogenase small subunit [Neobacillus endophyticus]
MKKQRTVYEAAMEHGFTRRDFLKMCTALAAVLGLEYTQSDRVVKAMETNSRVPVVWLQFQDCTGCSESFIRSSQPKTESVLLQMISLEYSEVLSAPSGYQAEGSMEQVLNDFKGQYILAVEGSIPSDESFLTVGGKSCKDTFLEMSTGAKAIIAYGSCSSWGGIAAAHPNPTGAKPVTDFVSNTPVILVPGCPPIAEVMTGVIAHMITFGKLPELDQFGRPKAFYRHRIHDKCNRRAYFDAGLFVESFDDEGAKQGYCLYKVGCKGPTTYNSCAEMRWNGGVSYPIQSGNPCIGCAERNFWDNGSFFTRRARIPGTQTTINPDTVGLAAIGVTTAGIAVHAAGTVAKKKIDDKRGGEV